MVPRFLIVACIVLGQMGCSTSSPPDEDQCLAITREYQAAMPDALVCDFGAVDACGVGRPVIVSEQAPDGTITLRGLCMAPCLAAVNPARTAALDEILVRFHAQGCTLGGCWCPRPESMPPTCMENGKCWGLGPE